MPKITSVEPQKKNPHRFNIFLDGEFAFGADEDLVVEYRLIPGKLLDTSDVEKLLFEAEVGKLMERMYRLFSIRQRSEKEVRDKLKIKNYELRTKGKEQVSNLAIEQLINKLKAKGMIDDLEFAKLWVESRGKKYGVNRIKMELYQKGIDREIIEEVIGGQSIENSALVARKLIDKKLERWKNLPPMELKKKAFDFLLRCGFDYEQVKGIVENILRKR